MDDLVKEVLQSEFPQNMKLKSKDGKSVILTFKNGKDVIISSPDENGGYKSEVYEFNDVKDNVVWPDSPEFPDYLAKLNLDGFNGIVNSDARDDYNNNIKHIQQTVNSVVDYSVSQKNYFDKLKDVFGNFKGFVETIISAKTAEFLSKFSDQYYKKEEIDNEVRILQSQIDHLKNENPTSNGVKKPGVF
ncbi:hypothetical protein [Companilactobacillus futsaii]|uniref:Uncharacterized protein n=2 Tax=Companilactobacillus futsaii TaxID=938155 RepID=A0A5B7T0C7_9LACO|nr:hypothetical protein [Companilactobacillus futsaii]KRK93635.1 hypothetical protein FC88_GL000211 [Companilactobacillus futsaii JCM 17355]QCX24040.1 hypothetical protein FG051_02500 [Companilactobacillus futsaii]